MPATNRSNELYNPMYYQLMTGLIVYPIFFILLFWLRPWPYSLHCVFQWVKGVKFYSAETVSETNQELNKSCHFKQNADLKVVLIEKAKQDKSWNQIQKTDWKT